MTCREIQLYLDDYFADRLDPDFSTFLQKHLESCEQCREEMGQLDTLTVILKMEKIPDPGEKYWDSLETEILSGTVDKPESPVNEKPLRPFITNIKYAVSLAAALVLFAITIVLSGPEKGPGPSSKIEKYQTAVAIAEYRSGSALISSILLSPPGSFGQQGIILGRMGHIDFGKGINDTRIN